LSLRPAYFGLFFPHRLGVEPELEDQVAERRGAHAPEEIPNRGEHAGLAGGDVSPVHVGYQEINQALVGFGFGGGLSGTMGVGGHKGLERDGERATELVLR
jgi:hypothetical protein